MSKNFQKKKVLFIIKVCKLESEGHFNSSQFISTIFANHKKITLLGSKKGASCPKCMQVVQTKQMQQIYPNKQNATN